MRNPDWPWPTEEELAEEAARYAAEDEAKANTPVVESTEDESLYVDETDWEARYGFPPSWRY